MIITYTYWYYHQKCTVERDGTIMDVLQEAINDIEYNTAYPVSICVDGVEVYNLRQIRDASYEYEGATIIHEHKLHEPEQNA
jgi:hypothetical protein